MFGRKRSDTADGNGRGHSRSPTRELKLPLPRSSRSSSVFAIEAAEAEEEKAGFETFAEFQRRRAVQAQPVALALSIPALHGSAEAEERPPPPRYQPRQPESPCV